MLVAATWFTMNPVLSGSIESSVVTSIAVVLSERCGSLDATIPIALSQTYQSPVVLVHLIKMNLAPAAKPQFIVCKLPLPVYDPTFEIPASVANKYATYDIPVAELIPESVPTVNVVDVCAVDPQTAADPLPTTLHHIQPNPKPYRSPMAPMRA